MRILLFDWYSHGHHPRYLNAFARVLKRRHEVIAAAPVTSLTALDQGVERIEIRDEFPLATTANRLGRARRDAVAREIELLKRAVRESRAEHAIHLFADGVLGALAARRVGARLSVLLFRPRHHLAALDGLPATMRERSLGLAYEAVVFAWRRSREAHAVLTLDPFAAGRWANRRGAPAVYIPEPPVEASAPVSTERHGAVLFGALSERKGIEYVVSALERDARGLALTLAGRPDPNYVATLNRLAARLSAAGVRLDLKPIVPDDAAALGVLSAARAALLPYVGHIGMSRVLLEAAAAGTPVVAHQEGLLGHLVRSRGLGVTVDCRNASALASALHRMVDDPTAVARYAGNLAAFAAEHDSERFAAAVDAPFEPEFASRR